jgi:hypothetical protein
MSEESVEIVSRHARGDRGNCSRMFRAGLIETIIGVKGLMNRKDWAQRLARSLKNQSVA